MNKVSCVSVAGMSQFGARIKARREELGLPKWSRAYVVRKVFEMGGTLSAETLGRWERGETDNPGNDSVRMVADVLGASVDYLNDGRELRRQVMHTDLEELPGWNEFQGMLRGQGLLPSEIDVLIAAASALPSTVSTTPDFFYSVYRAVKSAQAESKRGKR